MNATPSDFAAGPSSPVAPRASRSRWLWTALALGGGAALFLAALQQFQQTLALLLFAPLYTLHLWRGVVYSTELAPPVGVFLGALAVARWRRGIADRRAATLRLLATLALQVGLVVAVPVVVYALAPTEQAAQRLPGGQATLAIIGVLVSSASLIVMGVSLAVVLKALEPPPEGLRRWASWALAATLAGIPMAISGLLNPTIEETVVGARLAAVGVNGCSAGVGSGCYASSLGRLLLVYALPPLLGVIVGVVAGGSIAPSLVPSAGASPTPPAAAPPAPGPSQAARAWRYVAAAGAGLVYLALVIGAAYLGGLARVTSSSGALALTISVAEVSLALLVPAAFIVAVVARGWLAARLGPGGGRAGLRLVTALMAALALALVVVNGANPYLLFGLDVGVIALTAFTFGAMLGLLWAPSMRVALAGWSGVTLLAIGWVGYGFYSLTHVDAATISCHGLGCGALLLAGYSVSIGLGVYVALYGLAAAAYGGWLAGLLRAALLTERT